MKKLNKNKMNPNSTLTGGNLTCNLSTGRVKSFFTKKGLFYLVMTMIITIGMLQSSFAQLTGSKFIPGNYATVAAAVIDLNTQGVGAGGVIFEVAAGHTETLTARIDLTATGTLANPIVFRKDPATSGANPLLTAYTGTALATGATMDGMWALIGSDYVTIDGINLTDPNTASATTMMEYGYGLFKASATDGANNNTIQNCTITLNRNNNTAPTTGPAFQGSNGIALLASTQVAMQTSITVTAASGASSNNRFYSNTIQNVNAGITLSGFAAATPFTLADTNNDIGGASGATGNTIINFGGGTAAPNACAAVFVKDQWSFNVSYNTVNNNNGSGVNHPTTNRGIFANASSVGASATINNNNVIITGGVSTSAIDWAIDCEMAQTGSAGNTISISNNTISITKTVVSTVAFTAIWLQSAPTTANMNGNTITSYVYGGTSTSTTDNNVIRSGLAGVGTLNINNNTIGGVSTTAATGAQYLISVTGAPVTALNINGNNINGVTLTGATTKSFRGIYVSTAVATAAHTINNNNFQNISYSGGTPTGEFSLIYGIGTALTYTISGNTLTGGLTIPSTGAMYLIYNSQSTPNITVTNNTLSGTGINRTGTSGIFRAYYNFGSPLSGTGLLSGNTCSNVTLVGASTFNGFEYRTATGQIININNNTVSNIVTGSGLSYGIYNGYGALGSTVNNNTISNFSGAGTTYAIYTGSTAAIGMECNNNTISNVSVNGASAAAVYGIFQNVGGANVYSKNKIYGLSANGIGTAFATGIHIAGGTTTTLRNNYIGDVTTPIANAANALNGINIAGGTTVNCEYNTVYLNGSSSGALFGSSAINASTTPNLTLRNNIFINNSGFTGAGLTVAYRRSSTTLTSYVSSSNQNIFYAGTPGANRLIYTDGTNSDQTISAYKLRVTPADLNTATENVTFLSTTGSSPNFLHVDGSVASYTESGASNVTGITDDFDGNIRQGNVGYVGTGTAPDIGADEYAGIAIAPPTAPINFGSNTYTINSFNVTWDDNSTTEYGFIVYRSLNIGGPYVAVGAVSSTTSAGTGTSYSLAQTGLLGNTTYYYEIVANAASNSPVLAGSASTLACGGGLSGSYLIPTAYPTIAAALTSLKSLGMTGAVTLELESSYTGAGETYPLIVSDTIGCLNAINTLTLRPEATVAAPLTITSANTTATIDINSADYFTIDGRPGGVGSNKFLIVQNTSTTAAAAGNAILIRNEASNNTVTYVDIRSANANPAANTAVTTIGSIPGALAIGNTAGAFGNDNNTVSNCDVHSTGTNLGACIYAGNSTTAGTSANNDNNSILNNNLYDFFNAASASAGLDIASGNNNWTINGNSVYQTATRNYTTGTQTVRGFWITPNTGPLTSASGFTINNNFIGGAAPSCAGLPLTLLGTAAYNLFGMDISVGTGTASNVQNNVMTNWNITGGFSTNNVYGINIANGNVNVGTVTGNVIGSTTANGAITFVSTVTGGSMIALRSGAGGTINFSNNIISGIDLVGNATTVATGFNGIAGSGGANIIINNNTIGSTTLTNSINLVSASATSTTATAVRGIICNSGAAVVVNTITNNTISNINNAYSATGTQANSLVGIAVTTGASTVTGNIIRNLTSNTQTSGSGSNGAMIGINYTSTTAPALISGNTIHTLKLTNTGATGAVNAAGLNYSGSSVAGTSNIVEKNNIHSISIGNSANTAGLMTGMDIGSGRVTVKNNMIRLGLTETGADVTSACTVRGITKNTAIANILHNSVWIGGANVGVSAVNTFAFARSGIAVTDTILNNIFMNARSNATTGGKHYAISLAGSATMVLNYNDYVASGTGGVFGVNAGTDFPSYATNWVAGDANSYSNDPLFINAAGTSVTGDLHIDPINPTIIEGVGTSFASVSDDFDGQTRSGLTPVDVGADAGNFVSLFCNGTPIGGTATAAANAICVSGTKGVSLSGHSSIPGITLQWQESTVSGGPYTNVTGGTGATTASFTTPTISQDMYYVCVVTCSNGGATATSSEAFVDVNTPALSGTTPGTRCGTGTVLLQATAPVGTSINWYANPTGGTPLFTGGSFTTPTISSTTTYYAAPSSGGFSAVPVPGGNTWNQYLSTGNFQTAAIASASMVFDVLSPLTLNSMDIYPSAAIGSPFTIEVRQSSATGTLIASYTGVTTVQNSGTPSVAQTVPVNWNLPAGTNYVIGFSTNPNCWRVGSTTLPYPFTLAGYLNIQGSSFGTSPGTTLIYQYFFYNFIVSTGCELPTRTPVVATVTAPPTLSVTTGGVVCNDSIQRIVVTSTLADYDSYIWSPLSNLFEDSLCTIPYTGNNQDTVYLKTAVGGNYLVTCNATNSVTGCANVVSSTFTVQPPTTAVVSSVPNPSCAGTNVVLTALVASPASATVGTGTLTSTGAVSPYYRTFEGAHRQYLFTQAELAALGFSGGSFTQMNFPVTISAAPYNMDNFGVRMANTSATALTAFQTPTFTTVYTAGSFTPVSGNNNIVFSTPFNWDGVSNVLIDMYFDNDPNNTCSAGSPVCWGNTSTVQYSTTAFTSVVYNYSDNATGPRVMSSITTVTGSAATRPNITLTGNLASTPNSYSWSDGSMVVGSTNPLTVNPAVTTNYTVTAMINGCAIVSPPYSQTVIALPATPTPSAPSTQCGYAVPTASVTSNSGLPTPFFNWYNAASGGTLLQSSTSTTYSGIISSTTTFYVCEVSGICESPRVAVVANVTAFDPIAISANLVTCVGTPNTFTVNQTGSTNTYAYSWTATPLVGSGSTGTETGSPQAFTATAPGFYNYIVTGVDAGLGCTVYDTVTVNNYIGLSGTASATQISGCSNPTGLITANVSGAGTVVNEDFTSGVTPSNMTTAGNDFAIAGGRMQLTSAANSKNGGVLISNPTGLANNDFQIDFDFITTTSGSSPADGLSYSYGDDVVALPSSTATTTGVTTLTPENGSGTKLKLSFDAINNTGACPSVANGNVSGVYLMYNETTLHQGANCPGVLFYSPNTTWRATTTTGATTHVTITINSLGQVSMSLNNVQVVTNQQLPAAYLTADKSTWKHAFAARTGGLNEGHFIDNLIIQYNNFYEYSINGGASWSTTNPIVAPGAGTYSVDARYVSVPACSANLGSVTINPTTFTSLTSLPGVCTYTGAMPVLSFTPSFIGATYQWESSPAGMNTWNPIGGATSATYNPAPGTITVATDFRCVIMCGGIPISGSPSAPVTVTVDAPVITGTTPATRCGQGTVSLAATGTGSVLQWYASATGGSIIGTGSPFTTPVINSTTNYWVSSSTSGGTTQVSNNGLPNVTTSTQNVGLLFDLNQQVVLNSIDVYATAAGNVTVSILNSSLVTLYTSAPLPVIASNLSTPQTLYLGWTLTAGTGYRILVNHTTGALGYHTGTFPINMGNGVGTITNGATATGTTTLNYFVYNVSTSVGCESPRTQVTATVTAPPAITVSSNVTICNGQSTTLSVTSPNDPNYTYVWTPGAFTGASYVVNPTATTGYSVTATDNTAGPNAGCSTVGSVTVTVNPNPSVPVITQNPLIVCGSSPVTLTASSTQPGVAQVGTGTGTNVAVGQSPYSGNWEGSKIQYLITAAELNALNIYAGQLTSIAFNVTTIGVTFPMTAYTVKIGQTAASALTAYEVGLTQVYSAPGTIIPTLGWNTYNFSSGFNWNGTSNIVIEVCHNNDPVGACASCYGGTATVQSTTTATQTVYGQYADNTAPANPWDLCSQISTGTVSQSTNRPNMQVGYGATTNFLWSTGASTAAITVTPPSGTTNYSVVATNVFGCTSTNNSNVTSAPIAKPVIVENDTTLCNTSQIYIHVQDTGVYAGGYPNGTQFTWSAIGVPIIDLDSISSINGSSYSVIVTLPNGCTSNSDTAIVLTKSVAVVDVITNASCVGGGSVSVTVTSGLADFNYVWSTDLAQTNIVRNVTKTSNKDTLANLAAGTYYLQVYDEAGTPASCNSGVLSYIVGGSSSIVASVTPTDITCNGNANGAANVTWTGGNSPFSITWSDGTFANTTPRTIALGGSYSVIVSDLSGCADTVAFAIVEPSPVTVTFTSTPESFPGALDGTVTASPAGGTGPYSFAWADELFVPAGTGTPLGGLAAGLYYGLVTDANACDNSATVLDDSIRVDVITNATLKLKLIIEGYYNGAGGMQPALLNAGVGLSSTEVDTIVVELRDALSPATIVHSATVVINTNDSAMITLPGSVIGNSYYIAVFHRNAVQTWSDLPVTFSGVTNYDFTTAATQANGSNMIEVTPGVFAFYSGDIAPQDEVVDITDQGYVGNDIQNFAFGYVATDVSGDGVVDITDQAIVDNNINNFVGSIHP